MEELKLFVPTYNAAAFPDEVLREEIPEFGNPFVPVLVKEVAGIRIVLGSHDYDSEHAPDILVERRPNGWAIFLHPVGGGDPSGYVYFCDDGRSYLLPEHGIGVTASIEVVESMDDVKGVDLPG